MSVPTFAECKKILEDFYKERIKYNIDEIEIVQYNPELNIYENIDELLFKTVVTLKRDNFLIYDFFKHINPIIYYAYSYTSWRKYIKDDFILKQLFTYFSFLYEKDNNEYYIKGVKIVLNSAYYLNHEDYEFYFYVISELENNNELIISHTELTFEDEEEPTLEDEEKPKIINLFKIFKSDECIICMDNKPNILFCNCGHLCECEGCYKIKTPSTCPVCKMDNEIIRMLE